MNLDWQKLLSALGDFVTVMMPGMILLFTLTMACSDSAIFASFIDGKQFSVSGRTESWVTFLVVSYFLGHIVFLLGSFLDDILYQRIRDKTTVGHLKKLAKGEVAVFGGFAACFAKWAFKDKPDKAVAVAVRLKSSALGAAENHVAVNAYKWCKARLLREHPDGYASVTRFESDSKFFRSMIVIMPVIVFACFKLGYWPLGVFTLIVLFPLIVWRYVEQRFKATEEAYTHIIALDAEKLRSGGAAGSNRRAGGVVFRKEGDGFQYLLVETSAAPKRLVFPKGHIEPGETARHAAVREVLEETGAWGRIILHLADVDFGQPPEQVPVTFYLLEQVNFPKPNPDKKKKPERPAELWREDRKHQWLAYGEALLALKGFKESVDLLEKAADTIRDSAAPKKKQPA